jgi:amidase
VREEGLGIDYRMLYRAQGMVSAANFSANIRRWIEIKGREPGKTMNSKVWRGAATKPARS